MHYLTFRDFNGNLHTVEVENVSFSGFEEPEDYDPSEVLSPAFPRSFSVTLDYIDQEFWSTAGADLEDGTEDPDH